MVRVFSYGTLQNAQLQEALFGRRVPVSADAVLGYAVRDVTITDPKVINLSGTDRHTGLVADDDPDARVPGTVLSLDDAQFAAADSYESAYRRVRVALESGRWAWAYLPVERDGSTPPPGLAKSGPDDASALRECTVVLSGLGSVGLAFLRLLSTRVDDLRRRHRLRVSVLAVVDSSGAAFTRDGFELEELTAQKLGGTSVSHLMGAGHEGMTVSDVLEQLHDAGVRPDVLVEAGPADLIDGGAGLAAVRAARTAGMAVVLANKAPLVIDFDSVTAPRGDAADGSVDVRFSACVGAALPTIDLARAVRASAEIQRIQIVLNSTCQRVLGEMRDGSSVDEAIAAAQQAGLAEADPSLDVDGVDTAVKLVILSRALNITASLAHVDIAGIRSVTAQQLDEARSTGRRVVLLGTAEPGNDGSESWRLDVRPTALPSEHPLARMTSHETGLVIDTDVAGQISAAGLHHDVSATAAAVLRDLIALA